MKSAELNRHDEAFSPYSPVILPSLAVALDATRTEVIIIPQSPLPANTKVYLHVAGVTDVAGNTHETNWNGISFNTGAQYREGG